MERCTIGGAVLAKAPYEGIASSLVWQLLAINENELVEVALSSRLREVAVNHVVGSSSEEYLLCWNKSTSWCRERVELRCPLPSSEVTVALYL